jgi:hypothetical protein
VKLLLNIITILIGTYVLSLGMLTLPAHLFLGFIVGVAVVSTLREIME